MPDYSTHDPKGWGGNPRRGAAMGRTTLKRGDNATFKGKMTLRCVRLSDGGYDVNGTYFGGGAPLYWCAAGDSDSKHEVDFMLRAPDRAAAKLQVLVDYPHAKFYN